MLRALLRACTLVVVVVVATGCGERPGAATNGPPRLRINKSVPGDVVAELVRDAELDRPCILLFEAMLDGLKIKSDSVEPIMQNMCRDREDMFEHLWGTWSRGARTHYWPSFWFDQTRGRQEYLYCVWQGMQWRRDREVLLFGVSYGVVLDGEVVPARCKFVASLRWGDMSGLSIESVHLQRTEEGWEVVVSIAPPFRWGGEPPVTEEAVRRGRAVIKGLYDGKSFKWLGFYDKLGHYPLDKPPDAYHAISAKVTQ